MSLPRPRPPGKGSGKGEPATVTAFPSHLTLGTQQDEDRAAAAGCGQTATEEELFQPQSSNRDLPSGVSQDFWVPWSISATKCCCSNGQKKPFSSLLCTTDHGLNCCPITLGPPDVTVTGSMNICGPVLGQALNLRRQFKSWALMGTPVTSMSCFQFVSSH
ncbi:ADP-ribosylation factor-like protein 11 isoform X2 [Panthera leo]|uniref:ADP-ribosylation factor-like protein 11 isoform X2 n=1 Tax=Panthera leo TaxID=9689 RepID=UPI001C69891B|nr:ADP-ribosylation factor-like protein 11 isoform X2 [Panthera leo]